MATTYTITVQSTVDGNKYFVDGVQQDSLTIEAGQSYVFDQSDASNTGHPLALSRTDNGTHGGGVSYTNGVVVTGTAGTDRVLTFTAPNNAPASLYYYCQVHSGMGGSITVQNQTDNDPIRNFFKTLIVGQYSTTDTQLDIINTDAPKLPDPAVDGAYNLTIFTGSDSAESEFFEIVRVTAKSNDTLTVIRGQEGTDPLDMSNPADTFGVVFSGTKKTFDDIKAEIDQAQLDVQSVQDQLDSFTVADQDLNTTDDVTFDSVTTTSRFQLPSIAGFPSNPQIGDLFINSLTNELVVFNGSAFQRVAGDLVALLEKANATASIPQLDLGLEVLQPNATASSNLANMIALSQAQRLLELAEATSSGLDATMEFLLVPFTSWATTSNMLEATQQMGGAGDKDGALYFGGAATVDSGDNFTRTWDGSSWSATSSIPVSGHQMGMQHIGSKNDTMFTNRYVGNGNYPGNTYQWNGSSWASTTSSPQSGDRMMSFGITSDAIFHTNDLIQGYFYNGSSFSTTSSLPTDYGPVVFSGPDSSEGILAGQLISYVWNGSSWATTSAYPYNYNNGVGSSQGTNSVIATGGSVGFANPQSDSALWNGTTWATTSSANVQHYFGNGVGDTEGTTIVFGSGYYDKQNTTEVTV